MHVTIESLQLVRAPQGHYRGHSGRAFQGARGCNPGNTRPSDSHVLKSVPNKLIRSNLYQAEQLKEIHNVPAALQPRSSSLEEVEARVEVLVAIEIPPISRRGRQKEIYSIPSSHLISSAILTISSGSFSNFHSASDLPHSGILACRRYFKC